MSSKNRNRPMPEGRGLGILFAVIGTLATGIAWWLLSSNGSAPRILVAGPAMLTLGLAMIILPGSTQVSAVDYGRWFKASPWLHKIAWIASAIGGLYLAIRYLLVG